MAAIVIPKAQPHQRRVTLNLVRHAACCPEPLRDALDRLAELDWDMASARAEDLEEIFASVDEPLALAARDEFEADLKSIRDLLRDPRPGNPDSKCILCGHDHIRWEFALINKAGGSSTFTGSTCIVEYGLNIDGLGSSEAALAALQEALTRAKREAEHAEWREAHPDHEKTMAGLIAYERWVSAHVTPTDWRMWGLLRPQWKKRAANLKGRLNKVSAYYRQNKALTKLMTGRVFGKGAPLIAEAIAMDAEWYAAAAKLNGGAR